MCKTAKEVWPTLIITHKGNSQAKDYKIDLLTQQYKKFSILNYSSKNHVRKFLCALPLQWRANVTAIKEAKDLATLPLDELNGNLTVYQMILGNDEVVSKTIKEKVKSIALKAKVTREQTSDDSVLGIIIINSYYRDEDVDKEESGAFDFMARNFKKGNLFGCGNWFRNMANRFERGRGNSFGNKGDERSRQRRGCYNCGEEGHFIGECLKPKENKAFVGKS
nr:hypothetical protein [Tanacetum cinerariifolium]